MFKKTKEIFKKMKIEFKKLNVIVDKKFLVARA